MNDLGREDHTEASLRVIARDKKNGVTTRAAAERLLRTMEAPDLADFEPYLDGRLTLEQIRKSGINTEALKKARVKVRVKESGESEIEREIELYDRAGVDFDRVMDRTLGRATETVVIEDARGNEYPPEEYGRRAIEVGVQLFGLTPEQAWSRLPPAVQAVTPRPVVVVVVQAETKE